MENILIIGRMNTAVETLCKRLNREGDRVFVLSDKDTETRLTSVKVYGYEYDSDSVQEVFWSCHPNKVVFMGAYDTHFGWNRKSEKRDHRKYVAGLANILRISDLLGVERFVYVSSGEVFEDDYVRSIHEDTRQFPKSVKSTAISVGETMVRYYSESKSLDGVVARFDNLYFCPRDMSECSNVYVEACRKAMVDGEIAINTKIIRSGIWISDAVEAIHLLLHSPHHSRLVYHVTSGEEINEEKLSRIISDCCPREVHVKDDTVDMYRVFRLEDNYFGSEFGFRAHFSLADGISDVIHYIHKNITSFREFSTARADVKKGTESLFKKLFPFIESTVCFVIVVILEMLFGGTAYLARIDLFLLYVVLFALVHGLYQAVYASVLSMLGFFLLNAGQSSALELFMDISTYTWIAQLFIIGLAVGYQHDNLRQVKDDKDEEIDYLDGRLADITEINESTTNIKNFFESQVINSSEGLGFFYDIMTRLDNAEDNGVLFEIVQVLQKAMGTQDVAIYESSGRGYYRLLTSTTSLAYDMGKSINTARFSEIFDVLQKDRIFVNTTVNDRLPSMASSIVDEDGSPRMVLLLWNLPFERMTLQNRNMFRMLTLLVRGALLRANRYMDALIEKRFITGTKILNYQAFGEVERVYQQARNKELVQYELFRVELPAMTMVEASMQLMSLFRSIDVIGAFGENVYYVIAVNSSRQDARIIRDRLSNRDVAAVRLDEVRQEDISAAAAAMEAADAKGMAEPVAVPAPVQTQYKEVRQNAAPAASRPAEKAAPAPRRPQGSSQNAIFQALRRIFGGRRN